MTALDKLIEAVKAGTADNFGGIRARSPLLRGYGEASYNGSLDAALSLHEALLPEWQWQVFQVIGGKYVAVLDGPISSTPEMEASTPARAWLIAILRAYRSTQQ